MLRIFRKIGDLQFSEILKVYRESTTCAAATIGMRAAEEELYEDLSLFFLSRSTAMYVWEQDEGYVTCVRCEEYLGGALLTCLETAPEARRKGYALALLQELLALLKTENKLPAYVHIHKHNSASVALHIGLGFCIVKESAQLVDGTVSSDYYTMKYE